MIAKYIIDRESLYSSDYGNAQIELIDGNFDDKIKLKTHIPVIYRILKYNRKKARKNG